MNTTNTTCKYCSHPLVIRTIREDNGEQIDTCAHCGIAISARPIPLIDLVKVADDGVRVQDVEAWK